MRVYVTGSTGFVGRRVIEALLARDCEVVALSRDVKRVEARPGVEARALDLLDLDSIVPAIEDCDAGVHAAGAGPGASSKLLHDANVQATRNLVGSCRRKKKLRRLVAFSSAAVLETGDTEYRRAKLGMETAARSVDIDLTLLRPTLVLGTPDESTEMSGLVARVSSGTVPLPGGGRCRIQPVSVLDVADAAATAVTEERGVGAEITLAGEESGVAYREFLDGIRARTGGAARFLGAPLGLFTAAGLFAGLIGRRGRFSAVTAFFGRDHLYPLDDARTHLGFAPRLHEMALDELLSD